jgi:hypothetical protein
MSIGMSLLESNNSMWEKARIYERTDANAQEFFVDSIKNRAETIESELSISTLVQ